MKQAGCNFEKWPYGIETLSSDHTLLGERLVHRLFPFLGFQFMFEC